MTSTSPFINAARAAAFVEPNSSGGVTTSLTDRLQAVTAPPLAAETALAPSGSMTQDLVMEAGTDSEIKEPSETHVTVALRPTLPPLRPNLSGGSAIAAARATWGVRGVLQRAFPFMRVSPSARELAHVSAVNDIRCATWTRAVSIAVANPKGGVGKTPTTLIVGGVLAEIRSGMVVAVEATDAAGSLLARAEATATHGVKQLATVAADSNVDAVGRLGPYVAPQSSGLDVMGSPARRSILRTQDVRAVRSVVDRFYRISITDTGNVVGSEALGAVLEGADALVIPTLVSGDSVTEVMDFIDVVRTTPGMEHLADRLVILTMHDGRPETDHKRLMAILKDLPAAAIVDIPYDPHIAERGAITLAALSVRSRRAWTTATHAIITAVAL